MAHGLKTKIKYPKVGVGTGLVPGKLAKNKFAGPKPPVNPPIKPKPNRMAQGKKFP